MQARSPRRRPPSTPSATSSRAPWATETRLRCVAHARACPDERIMVCSDGLTKVVTEARIAEVMELAGDDVAQRLVGAALWRTPPTT